MVVGLELIHFDCPISGPATAIVFSSVVFFFLMVLANAWKWLTDRAWKQDFAAWTVFAPLRLNGIGVFVLRVQ